MRECWWGLSAIANSRNVFSASSSAQTVPKSVEPVTRISPGGTLPLTAISPDNRLCLPEFVVREFYCPGCATSLAADVQRREEPILDECQLSAPGGQAQPDAQG